MEVRRPKTSKYPEHLTPPHLTLLTHSHSLVAPPNPQPSKHSDKTLRYGPRLRGAKWRTEVARLHTLTPNSSEPNPPRHNPAPCSSSPKTKYDHPTIASAFSCGCRETCFGQSGLSGGRYGKRPQGKNLASLFTHVYRSCRWNACAATLHTIKVSTSTSISAPLILGLRAHLSTPPLSLDYHTPSLPRIKIQSVPCTTGNL